MDLTLRLRPFSNQRTLKELQDALGICLNRLVLQQAISVVFERKFETTQRATYQSEKTKALCEGEFSGLLICSQVYLN